MIILANGRQVFESPARKAGRKAEINAREWIKDQLNEEDVLLCNVEIIYDGMRTELDDVIVNSYGVFIVEVKYYSGELEGDENDREWTKYHMSSGYNVYVKSVRNPIIQLKREIHILANYLREQGFNVWVKGYVLLTEDNSPVASEYILDSVEELGRLVHTTDRKRLNRSTVEGIRKALISYGD
ncbi:MAG: NERD domain-containing protein [Erysipelotrichaceae bacterium]|nr:NERD domain-containing protein [Erysipelotrichaceae bacterium]